MIGLSRNAIARPLASMRRAAMAGDRLPSTPIGIGASD